MLLNHNLRVIFMFVVAALLKWLSKFPHKCSTEVEKILFHVLVAGCSLVRAEGFRYFYVLHGGLGIGDFKL